MVMKKIIQFILLISLLPVALYSQTTICRNAYVCNKKDSGITYVSYLTVNSTYKQQIDSIVGNKIYISGSITVADNYPWISKDFSESLGNLSNGEYILQHSVVIAKNKWGDTTNLYYETDTIYTTFNVFNGKYIKKDSFYTDGMKWITAEFEFDYKGVTTVSRPIYYTYVINGDTIIGGNRYKKMAQFYRNRYNTGYWRATFFARYENGKYMFNFPDDYYRGDFFKYYNYWIGDEVIFFDENLKSGDYNAPNGYEKIACIGDTLFDDSPDEVRRYWKGQPSGNEYSRYECVMGNVLWIEGIGSLSQPLPYFIGEYDCACFQALLYCINPEGDTIYRNQKYIDLIAPYFNTNIEPLKIDDISITQQDGECVVTLPVAAEWAVTLYNAAGISVACKAGEGSEIFLPVDGKGTHILVLEVGGKQYTKKVMIK